jgi:hypothetical protein
MKSYEVRTILAITVIAWESLDSAMPIVHAFLKGNIDYVTADPRCYRDQLDRCSSSRELVPIH